MPDYIALRKTTYLPTKGGNFTDLPTCAALQTVSMNHTPNLVFSNIVIRVSLLQIYLNLEYGYI